MTKKFKKQLTPFLCPACGSHQIEGGPVEVWEWEEDKIKMQHTSQECGCLVCNTEWQDIYKLDRTIIISVPKEFEYLLDEEEE